MNYECDLHGHTDRSDGCDTPIEYILHAKEQGLKIVAITDHDIRPPENVTIGCENYKIEEFAKAQGINLIRGIEISCQTYIEDVHLVCFGCDWNSDYFTKLERETVRSKTESYRKLIRLLKEKGVEAEWDEILEYEGVPEEKIQKKMIFEYLSSIGFAERWKEAKKKIKNDPALNIFREKPEVATVIREVHKCGGIVILAHPYLIDEPVSWGGKKISRDEFIEILIQDGIDGIEASYTYDKTSYSGLMSKQEIEKEVRIKYSNRLAVISGGSDYHGDGKKGVNNPRELGECGISMDEFVSQTLLRKLIE